MRLFTKFMLCMVIVVIASVTIVSWFSIRRQTNALSSKLISGKQQLAVQIANATENGFRTLSWLFMERMLKDAGEEEDIVFCWLVKPDNFIYLADKRQDYGLEIDPEIANAKKTILDYVLPSTGEKGIVVIEPAELAGEIWKVVLGVSVKDIEETNRDVVRHNVYIALVTIASSALIVFILSRGLTNPIAKLANAAERIAGGDMEFSAVEFDSRDEVGALAESFNKMTKSLGIAQGNLREYSQNLEEEIAEREKAEAALQNRLEVEERMTGELKKEVDERKRTEEELARSNAELRSFAYVASHDLQEPLRMVGGYLQLLERRYKDKIDDDASDFIAFAVDGANRMQRLINDLLEYSRVSTRGKDLEPTDLESVLEQNLANLQMAIEESSAMVTHDPLSIVMADNTQMIQLLQNLIGNAIKFRNEESPHVHISVEQKGSEWIFSVRDNGIGIDPEYADRIFVIFQRLHGVGEYAGTGIGLAVCKRIVERHGGRIWMESQPGDGSTFYFTIPVTGEQ